MQVKIVNKQHSNDSFSTTSNHFKGNDLVVHVSFCAAYS